MDIRLTVEIDDTKYGMLYKDAENISSEEFAKVVKFTIDRYRGYKYLAPLPEEEV